jgi:hypothetical protein
MPAELLTQTTMFFSSVWTSRRRECPDGGFCQGWRADGRRSSRTFLVVCQLQPNNQMILMNIDARDRILQHFAVRSLLAAGRGRFFLSDKVLKE